MRQDVGHTLFLPIKNDEEKLNVTNNFLSICFTGATNEYQSIDNNGLIIILLDLQQVLLMKEL